jgi:hypothetical protein
MHRAVLGCVAILLAVLAAARCGKASPAPCSSCNLTLDSVQCEKGCTDDTGKCVGTGEAINEGVTCAQTNQSHGVCHGGTCSISTCGGPGSSGPCTTNPHQCFTGTLVCVGGTTSCNDQQRKPDGTACDGGVCTDGGCGP